MQAEYAGLWVLLSLVAALCLGIAWGSRRLARHFGDASQTASHAEPAASSHAEPAASSHAEPAVPSHDLHAGRSQGAGELDEPAAGLVPSASGPVVLLFLVFGVAALFFAIWGVVARDAGRTGALVMLSFALPLVSGLIHAWSKDLLE